MSHAILNTIGSEFTEEAKKILGTIGNVTYKTLSQEELKKIINEYDIVVVGLGNIFDKDVLDRATQLKIIATATTGLDHIDVEYAKKRGIRVLSLRGEEEFLRTISGTAELAWGLILDLLRGVSSAAEAVKRYEWNREQFCGHSLTGKVLGIVGLGRLGSMVARYGQAFGMKVIAYDPYVDPTVFQAHNVKMVSFAELLSASDIVSLHVHLSLETENMFTRNEFQQMKPSSYLINTARGKIVNESDVLEALQQNMISGYATDVLAGELSFTENFSHHPLVEYAKTHNNLLIVPHIGGMTHESREATDIFIAKKVVAWCK